MIMGRVEATMISGGGQAGEKRHFARPASRRAADTKTVDVCARYDVHKHPLSTVPHCASPV
jgi:hypothetical protein